MKIPKCQSNNPATCVDPQCPEKRFHDGVTANAAATVSSIQRRFDYAKTPEEFASVNDQLKVALMDADATRGGIQSLEVQHANVTDNFEKHIIFARLEMAKERFAKKFPPSRTKKTINVMENTKENYEQGYNIEYAVNHPVNEPYERKERAALRSIAEDRFIADEINKPHTYQVPVQTTVQHQGYQTISGSKVKPNSVKMSETSRDVRNDIKQAVKDGYLPEGVKYSVHSFSSGSLHVYVRGLKDTQIYGDDVNSYGDRLERPEILELTSRLEKISEAYNEVHKPEGPNRAHGRYYTTVRVEDEQTQAWRTSYGTSSR